jgi:hypothetical protein
MQPCLSDTKTPPVLEPPEEITKTYACLKSNETMFQVMSSKRLQRRLRSAISKKSIYVR